MPKLTAGELNDYRTRANADEIAAQIYLGWAYVKGTDVEKDESLGRALLERAANLGSKEAAYRLASCLILRNDGDGIARLTQLSAENYAPAAYDLGNCYYAGFLVERDSHAAAREWSHAANNGHLIAKIKLLKFQSQLSPLHRKPLIFLKMFGAFVLAASVLLRDMSDPRVLGSLK